MTTVVHNLLEIFPAIVYGLLIILAIGFIVSKFKDENIRWFFATLILIAVWAQYGFIQGKYQQKNDNYIVWKETHFCPVCQRP